MIFKVVTNQKKLKQLKTEKLINLNNLKFSQLLFQKNPLIEVVKTPVDVW